MSTDWPRIIALLCLLFSDLNSNRSLGPIAAIGIIIAIAIQSNVALKFALVSTSCSGPWATTAPCRSNSARSPTKPSSGRVHNGLSTPISASCGASWRRLGARRIAADASTPR